MFKKIALKFFANQPVNGRDEAITEEPVPLQTVYEYFTSGKELFL